MTNADGEELQKQLSFEIRHSVFDIRDCMKPLLDSSQGRLGGADLGSKESPDLVEQWFGWLKQRGVFGAGKDKAAGAGEVGCQDLDDAREVAVSELPPGQAGWDGRAPFGSPITWGRVPGHRGRSGPWSADPGRS